MSQLRILLILLSFSLSANSQIITDGLIGYWSIDGNANEGSGNANDGTFVGNPVLTQDRDGNSNSAYNFDGVDDYIDLGNDSSINSAWTSFSVSAWVKIDNNPSSRF